MHTFDTSTDPAQFVPTETAASVAAMAVTFLACHHQEVTPKALAEVVRQLLSATARHPVESHPDILLAAYAGLGQQLMKQRSMRPEPIYLHGKAVLFKPGMGYYFENPAEVKKVSVNYVGAVSTYFSFFCDQGKLHEGYCRTHPLN